VLAGLMVLALSGQPCWDIYDEALRHRAAAPHPPYVQYDMRTAIEEDGYDLVAARSVVRYRADGLARVEDTRFQNYSWVTDHVEPGPPELGPYGADRSAWLPLDEPGMPLVIATVHRRGSAECTDRGLENYRGHLVYHLALTPYDPTRPALKGLWVDATTSEIWKVLVSGTLTMINAQPIVDPTVDFVVELAPEGPYVMVDHVTFAYRMPVFSQYSDFLGEYSMSNFQYPASMPASMWALSNHDAV